MNVSDYAALQRDAFRVKTGVAVAVNDLLQFGPDGRAYPVKFSDYAAVANCNYGTPQTTAATGMIVAQTQVVAGNTIAYHRQALLQGDDGSLYAFTLSSAGVGIMLTRYSPSGGLISQVIISAIDGYSNHQAFFLSNGSICVVAGVNGGAISFAIFDKYLNIIKSITSLVSSQSSSFFSACALSGGGFAVIYHSGSSPLESIFVSYSNTGVISVAPTTVWTRVGTSGIQYHRIALLSSGNLAVAVHSNNTVNSFGLFYAVLSPNGSVVKAFTNLNAVASSSAYIPELSVMQGKFAIAKVDTTNLVAFIFDDAGNLQGSGFSQDTGGASASQNSVKLLNNGVDFWMLWSRSTGSQVCLTKLPITGANYTTTVVTTTVSQYGRYFDAFAENGLLVVVSSTNNTENPYLFLIDQLTGTLVSSSVTAFGVGPSSGSTAHRVIPVGDFAFACLYGYSGPASTNLAVGKYANTAILGCANSAAAAGTLVPVSQKASGYAVNYVKGSPSKSFDHSAANIIGNKGTIMNYGAVLKGI